MSSAPDRDRDLERLLRQAMPGPSPAAPECLDAEALAAWADGGLDAHARLDVESHVASCARCQAIVAMLVQSEPVAAAPVPWWRASMVRWLAPAALVTAAATVWILLPAPGTVGVQDEVPVQARRDTSAAETESAVAEQESGGAASAPGANAAAEGVPEPPAPATVAPAPAPPPGSVTFNTPLAPAERAQAADAMAEGRLTFAPKQESVAPALTPAPVAAPAVAEAATREVAAAPARDAARSPAAAPAPASPAANEMRRQAAADAAGSGVPQSPSPGAAAGAAAQARTAQATAESKDAARKVAPAAPAAAPRATFATAAPAEADAMREEAQVGQTRAPATLDVASPDGRERWRVRGAIVEHTQDDGRSWEIRSLAGGATALAGASPARGVCWLVGPAGTVLLTTDGSRWTRVSAPAVIDLVLVEARDARTATVTARDGRRFTTSDGGVTWRP